MGTLCAGSQPTGQQARDHKSEEGGGEVSECMPQPPAHRGGESQDTSLAWPSLKAPAPFQGFRNVPFSSALQASSHSSTATSPRTSPACVNGPSRIVLL